MTAATPTQTNASPITTASPLATPAEPGLIALWPDAPAPNEQWTLRNGLRVLRNVASPALLPVLPPAGQGNGRAVLVVPGGGFRFLAIDHEGLEVAQALAQAGYTAYVLKYRVLPTAVDSATFVAEYDRFIASALSRPADERGRGGSAPAPAVDDARLALRWLRGHSAVAQFDAERIGYVGFSAGALIGRALVEAPEPGAVPHSLALLYGSMLALPDDRPAASLPPLFLAMADNDPLFGRQGFALVESWQRAGQRVELHWYERGDHGFGMQTLGCTSDAWFDAYRAWLARQ